MATVHGIPLLSDSPPAIESDACRKCNKEFNLFFTRSRKCNHCGCSYCHSCSDFQALLPRSGSGSGYDSVHVCGYCIELLNVTAAGPGRLRGMPLSKLKTYASSYNIDISRAVEKNDIIEAILNARGPNGCLPQSKEDFYRKNKVPNPHSGSRPRGLFSRSNAGNPPPVPPRPPPPQGRSGGRDIPNPRPQFPQPQAPHTHYQPSYAASPQPQGHPYQAYTPPRHQPQQQYNAPPHHNFQHQPPPPQPPRETRPRPPSRSNSAAGNRSSRPPPRPRTPPRQRTTSSPPQPQPHSPPAPVPTPTLDQLLVMTQSSIAALSVSVLKSILFMNHVNVTMVLEKSELVKKVVALVDDEKRERERQRMAEEAERFEEEERRREREEAIRREEEEREERLRKERQRNHRATVEDVEEGIDEMLDVEVDTVMDEDEDKDEDEDDVHQGSSSANSQPKVSSSPNHTIPAAVLERSGLCVICQDEEANIAIVDCGHMVMCRACSELIMHGSRECPLCRTRIVTEARLLRIFKS